MTILERLAITALGALIAVMFLSLYIGQIQLATLCVGTLAGVVGALLPATKERFVFEQPIKYKAKVVIESVEKES